MMCYKDMTFCEFYIKCNKGGSCYKALTPKIIKDAVKWWGGEDFPIAVFVDKPDCYEEK